MFAKYFHEEAYDGQYRERGHLSRLTKGSIRLARKLRLEAERRARMPIPQEYYDHIGGYIEVVTYGFGENATKYDEFYQYGYLTEIDEKSKYVRWTCQGHTMPPVHIDNIKLLSDDNNPGTVR